MSSEPAQIEIRPVMKADVEAISRIAEALATAPQWLPKDYEEVLRAHGSRRITLVACAPHDREVIGFVIASLVAPEAELESVAIAQYAQRRGVGRRLLEELISHLRGAGIKELLLEVRASNHAAIALYTALGFRQTGRRPHYYADNDEDAILMSLRMEQP